ncbi:MAG: hypothetical protein QG635_1849 [Bacteroidota bacterium]|nr:hypothetical protein [Bacteroidota bacterium]
MKFIIPVSIIWLLLVINSCSENSTDNSNSDKYGKVTIGTQVWMLKNLDENKYRNGDLIPQVTDSAQWANLTTGVWCYYNNDSSNGAIYGKLYNWYAVTDPRGLAPSGWHVPTDDEWNILANYLGGSAIAGGKMKEIGNEHWKGNNSGATNESGFTALPGGMRNLNGAFNSIGDDGHWWSSSIGDTANSWSRYILSSGAQITKYYYKIRGGFSVRCVKE